MGTILFNERKIRYTVKGRGKTIVLIHGFTETSAIWKSFRKELTERFRVITLDLPGHGKSECVAEVHTMELQAEIIKAVLDASKVKKCLMIGHSLGGYAVLAFAELYPEMLRGLCLFHSHAFAVSQTDRENRERTIELVKNDKFGFLTQFIPSLFPPEVHQKFSKEIDKLIRQAGTMEKEAIIAALEGMKVRSDRLEVLRNIQVPVLFILWMKDIKSPIDRLWEMISLPKQSELLLLGNTGHMGFIEEPSAVLDVLFNFARCCLRKKK